MDHKKRILTLVTGGFDPIHSGHIAYFKKARELTNYLVVGLNTEEWLKRKKGQYFQSWKERAEIIRHLDMVDAVITVEDDDKGSACKAIETCLDIADTVVFANGGDRGKDNTPELDRFCNDARVEFYYGVGGSDKLNSSSWLLHDYFQRQRRILGI
jgi:D-beta-D-heptose 7-phosphate kinase/D-beta-D-heptose 1-phosphate adenosyltransferase|tara:strand:- start:602 stop:1069 length:468 start_codon:yes stop_codon:yes gene_type:complete